MNLARHLSVLWRFKIVVAVGLILAIGLAYLAAYDLSGKRRGTETWSSTSQILVTQAGFPWGRSTLPSADGTDAAGDEQSGDFKFGDPIRFASSAQLFSILGANDEIRRKLPERPDPSQIELIAVDYTGNGNSPQPIMRTTTTAVTAKGAQDLNRHMISGMQSWLKQQQDEAEPAIPAEERIELSVFSAPSKAILIDGPTKTPSILAFVLVALATLALVHILEALRPRRDAQAATTLPAGGPTANAMPAPQGQTVYNLDAESRTSDFGAQLAEVPHGDYSATDDARPRDDESPSKAGKRAAR